MLALRYVDKNDNEQGFKMKVDLRNVLKNETMLLSRNKAAIMQISSTESEYLCG